MVSYPGQIPGNATVGGTLTVTGNTALDQNLTVSGSSTLGGNSQVDGTLTVNSDVVVAATVHVTAGVIDLGADVNLYRQAANILQTDDYFVMPNGQTNGDFTAFGNDAKSLNCGTLGGGLAVKEGANARSGVSTLVAGTVTVANTSVTATSRIQLTAQSLGTVTAPKTLGVTARTAGTSFTITSADATDTSVVAWFMIEPS